MLSSRPFAVLGRAVAAAAASFLASGSALAATGEKAVRLGAPYEAGGVWFVPAADPSYDETGLAAAYQAPGRTTASGERFDPHALAGAHATLPLPGVVEVTNLDTGKRLSLRINDRGPYAPGRILSLTPAAAQALGVAPGASARVRVRYADAPARRLAAERTEPGRVRTSVAHGRYAVQVGAFADRDRADRAVQVLAAAGRAVATPLDRQGLTLWRVTLGPLPDEDAAQDAQARARELGFAAANVVQPAP